MKLVGIRPTEDLVGSDGTEMDNQSRNF